jgi:hypothetical protein
MNRRRGLHIMDPRGHGRDLAQPALRVGGRDIRPAGQQRHEDGRVPVRFAAFRVGGYRFGRRKPGVMNGTKRRGLVPDQRRRVAVDEGEDPVLVLAQDQHVPVAAVVDRQPVNGRSDAACHPAPGHDPGPGDTLDPVQGLR